MTDFIYPSDRTLDSTDNNEFADGLRDETMIPEDLIDTESLDDEIPEAVNEYEENPRPLYNELGVRNKS